MADIGPFCIAMVEPSHIIPSVCLQGCRVDHTPGIGAPGLPQAPAPGARLLGYLECGGGRSQGGPSQDVPPVA